MKQSDKAHLQWTYDRLALVHLEPMSSDYMRRLQQVIDTPDDQEGMLTAFRHAANSLALEAGVIASHKDHGGILGDHYFLELIAESELRIKRLSIKYERLRAAAITAMDLPSCSSKECVILLNEGLSDES